MHEGFHLRDWKVITMMAMIMVMIEMRMMMILIVIIALFIFVEDFHLGGQQHCVNVAYTIMKMSYTHYLKNTIGDGGSTAL